MLAALLWEKVGWRGLSHFKTTPTSHLSNSTWAARVKSLVWVLPWHSFLWTRVVLLGFPVRSVAQQHFCESCGGTNPEQPYAYILQWTEPLCIPLGWLTSMAAAGTICIDLPCWYHLLMCPRDTKTSDLISFWRVCLTRTGCSATRCLYWSWSVGGWYCMRTSRIFFSLLS